MKATLFFTTLTMMLAMPTGFAKSELETLRSLCAEQERQIRHLEDENSKLRSDTRQESTPKVQSSSTKLSTTPKVTTTESSYTVKAGDSVERIARRVGMTPEKLAKANGLKANAVIQPGQKLKITSTNASAAKLAGSGSSNEVAASISQTENKTHTIKQGETYFSIAKKHNVSTASLIAANPSVKPSAMRPGQVVRITHGSTSMTTVSAPAPPKKASVDKPLAPVVKTTETQPSSPLSDTLSQENSVSQLASPPPAAANLEAAPSAAESKLRPITIDGEMTYGEFAAKHGTDAERLNALNGLDLTTATVLAKGSELYVPSAP